MILREVPYNQLLTNVPIQTITAQEGHPRSVSEQSEDFFERALLRPEKNSKRSGKVPRKFAPDLRIGMVPAPPAGSFARSRASNCEVTGVGCAAAVPTSVGIGSTPGRGRGVYALQGQKYG
jgi:hypothetical protein